MSVGGWMDGIRGLPQMSERFMVNHGSTNTRRHVSRRRERRMSAVPKRGYVRGRRSRVGLWEKESSFAPIGFCEGTVPDLRGRWRLLSVRTIASLP